jgi:parallel beta-helix repeat protein
MKNGIISINIVGMLVVCGFVGLHIATDQVDAAGPTYVSGPINSDTTWYFADSPYIVMGDVTVEPGFTLIIEPGVEVKFDDTYSIIVDGTLIADGTSINTIKFTSNQSSPAKGDWYTIRLRTDYNLINYAEVEYASYGIFMTLFGTHNTVSNSTFKYCKFDGVYITNSDNNMISNCTSSFNDRFGITIYESYGTQVDNCTIQYNNFFGINLNASTFTEIYYTNISYNDGKGILLYSNSHNTTILGCEIDWNSNKGIDLWGTSDNNVINTTAIGNNGVGIDFGGASKRQFIDNCTITDNEGTGIDLRGSSYSDIVGCYISRNGGNGGIYSASPVYSISISYSKILNHSVGNGIDIKKAKWVNITHSNISGNAGNGIYFNTSVIHSNIRIQNCTIAKNGRGVFISVYHKNGISYVENNILYFNRIYSNKNQGIYFYAAGLNAQTYIQNNNIYSNMIHSNVQDGILFSSDGNFNIHIQYNNIYSNAIYSNNDNGLHMRAINAIRNRIRYNDIHHNLIHSNKRNGIYFSHYKGTSIRENYIRNNNMYSNIIYSNGQNGICFDAYIYSNTIYQHIQSISNFNNAMDNSELNFITGGDANWEIDTSTYYYDGDSARSGDISDNQVIYIETEVIGPGTLSFYWKVSSAESDRFRFYLDNAFEVEIYGNIDWHQRIYNIGSGFHTLKWIYKKDGSTSAGSDCGWLDKVEFTGQSYNCGIFLHTENPTPPWQDSQIYNNTIISNIYGIILSNMNSQVSFANNISYNNVGILLDHSISNTFRYNNITYNNLTGIALTSSSNNNLIENNNITSNNKTGILITENSNDNLIFRNNITYNLEIGINVTEASGNQIHHNNFINNVQNAYDSTIALNDWDDGAEGNFWSDYLGTDDDDDGFGEDPYVIPGGGSRDWHSFIEYVNVTPPYIILTIPADGEVNVPVDTTVTIFFSKEMNTTAVQSAISISGGLTPTGYVWDSGNKNVTFTPSSILEKATKYMVTINTDAKDTQGNRIRITYVFSFTTLDQDPPVILLTSPYNGDTYVDRNAPVIVTFNETMKTSSVNFTCFPNPGGWTIIWSANNTVASYFHNKFGNEATYTFNITAAKDLAGNDLIAGPVPNPWWFSTPDLIGPEIISTSPFYDEVNVSTTAIVVVDFNEEIDKTSITYTCNPDPLGWNIVWTNNNKTTIFLHNDFTDRTWYSFHVTGAKDLLGNDLNAGPVPNPWHFTTTGDYTPPQITLTSPVNNTFDVELETDIIVTFNEAMDNSSLNFICIPDCGGWSETWSAGNTIVTFGHNPFENATTYTFHINTGWDVAGNNLIQGTVPNPWSFTTVGDLVAPEIISTSPAHNEENVKQDANVVVTFNEAIDPTFLDFTCTPDPGGWSETWSTQDMIVTFSHNLFEIDTTYIFQITAARDKSGNDLTSGAVANPWLFTTVGDIVGPQIILTSPADNEVDVTPSTNIIATFNEAIDNTSLNYICIPDPDGWSESWSNGDTVVTFTHNSLAYGTVINFYVIAAKDISGNDLTPGPVPNPWSFTTSDIVSPEIILASPADNEINVGLNANIEVTFSEAMDSASISFICTPDPGGWSETWSNGDRAITFTHDPFEFETLYDFYIISGKDIIGNDLVSGSHPNPWSFTTERELIAPQIKSTIPFNGELNVSLNSLITITFSEAMDTSSIDYTCTPDPGGWFESWSDGDTVLTLLHNPFDLGTTYKFNASAAKDLFGNDLTLGEVPGSWDFTTVSLNSLIIIPSEVNIYPNDTIILLAWALDSQNDPIRDVTYTWTLSNDLGTISSQGSQIAVFQAKSNTGTCYVNVTFGGKSASAKVTIISIDIKKEEPADEEPENLLWLWFLILVIIVLFFINLRVAMKKEKPKIEEESPKSSEDETPLGDTGNDEEEVIDDKDSETPPPPLDD